MFRPGLLTRLRKPLSLLAAASMLALAACTQQAPPAGGGQGPSPAAGSSAPASGGGGAAKTVKIAYIGPLTGSNAAAGIGMKNSFDLAIKEANRSGELKGIKLEPVFLDDASDPATGVAAANKAGSDPDVIGIIGLWASPVALATIETIHQHGLPAVAMGVNSKITQSGHPEIFRMPPTDEDQARTIVNYLLQDLKKKRIYVIDDKSAFGKNIADFAEKFFKQGGAELLGRDSITVGEKDFNSLLTKVKGTNPDAIYFAGYNAEGGLMRQQMVKLGMDKVVFAGTTGIWSDAYIKIAGKDAEGTVIAGSGAPVEDLQGYGAFLKAYQAEGYKEPHEGYGPYTYTATKLMIEALKKSGPDRKKLVAAMHELKDIETMYGKVGFAQNGQLEPRLLTVYQVKDGKWTTVKVAK